jgi:VanZ family protein
VFLQKNLRLLIAIAWLIFISSLFFLPGAAFPKADWLSDIQFDKWVHIGFFIVLVGLWSWALETANKLQYFFLVFAAILYGLCVELVQHYLVVNRSFDPGDLVADSIGALLGLFIWVRYIKK